MKTRLITALAALLVVILAVVLTRGVKTTSAPERTKTPAVAAIQDPSPVVPTERDPRVQLLPHDLTGDWSGGAKYLNTSIKILVRFPSEHTVMDSDQMFMSTKIRRLGSGSGTSGLKQMLKRPGSKAVHIRSDFPETATGKSQSVEVGDIYRTRSGKTYITLVPPIRLLGDEPVSTHLFTQVQLFQVDFFPADAFN